MAAKPSFIWVTAPLWAAIAAYPNLFVAYRGAMLIYDEPFRGFALRVSARQHAWCRPEALVSS
ncbi:hypothetical protein [Novosphingobium sp. M1R2S20]|uniref:Uncharacterized protein n=1 Tax=Novosphingobium rhizovicinum TaxID=3228928 RepID=A0ABV3R6A7_9SPHN